MEIKTHLAVNNSLCGKVVSLSDGAATVVLETTQEMLADNNGLVHGGFIFGAADYAAMVAVNDPYVVLGSADVKFTAPVRAGNSVTLEARVVESKNKKRIVSVEGKLAEITVLSGLLTCIVLEKSILD